jgi:hypothetical protein
MWVAVVRFYLKFTKRIGEVCQRPKNGLALGAQNGIFEYFWTATSSLLNL